MKIEGLENLVNLEDLYLSDNGIEKIEGLENNVSRCQLINTISHMIDLVCGLGMTCEISLGFTHV